MPGLFIIFKKTGNDAEVIFHFFDSSGYKIEIFRKSRELRLHQKRDQEAHLQNNYS